MGKVYRACAQARSPNVSGQHPLLQARRAGRWALVLSSCSGHAARRLPDGSGALQRAQSSPWPGSLSDLGSVGSDVVGALSRAELRSDSDSTGTGESSDVERDDAACASDIRPDHLLSSAEGTSEDTAPDSLERSPLLDDAREQIDTLASDDDAAPGDTTGQDAGDGDGE